MKMGNDKVSRILAFGTICLETSTGCRLTLGDVNHVPNVRVNKISAGKLDDDGYSSYIGEGNGS